MKHRTTWHLHQPRPGHFTWTSPLGHTYHQTEDHPTNGPPPETPTESDDDFPY